MTVDDGEPSSLPSSDLGWQGIVSGEATPPHPPSGVWASAWHSLAAPLLPLTETKHKQNKHLVKQSLIHGSTAALLNGF